VPSNSALLTDAFPFAPRAARQNANLRRKKKEKTMSRLIHFDLSADNPERAAGFYRGVFNWKVNRWKGPEDYWLIPTGTEEEPGVTGGIAGRIKPEDTTAVVFDVESVDEVSNKVIDAGGTIREEKKAIPGVGYLIMCTDTEGNTFGIMQMDESVNKPAPNKTLKRDLEDATRLKAP